jgi:hypothetical protein
VAEDGTFALEGLRRGEECVLVVGSRGEIEFGRSGRILADGSPVLVELDPMESIEGRVLDADGNPVGAGQQVEAVNQPIEDSVRICGNRFRGDASWARTREDGTFTIEFLDRRPYVVRAWRTGGDPRDRRLAEAHWIPAGSTGVMLRLMPCDPDADDRRLPREPGPHRPAASAITGRAVSPSGSQVLPDTRLEVIPEAGGERHSRHLPRSGTFDTGTLPEGRYTLRVLSGSNLPCGEAKGVRSGTRDLELRLDPRGTIEGRVLDSSGRPVGRGLRVRAELASSEGTRGPGHSSFAWTRDDGTFTVEYLGDFEFALTAHPMPPWRDPLGDRPIPKATGDLASRSLTGVHARTQGVVLRLEAPVVLTGTVLLEDGYPLSGCELVATQEGRAGAETSRTGAKGVFRFERLAAGKVRLRAKLRGRELDLGEWDAPGEGIVFRLPGE